MGLVERDYFEISGAVASVKIGGQGGSSHNFAINTNNPYILSYRYKVQIINLWTLE